MNRLHRLGLGLLWVGGIGAVVSFIVLATPYQDPRGFWPELIALLVCGLFASIGGVLHYTFTDPPPVAPPRLPDNPPNVFAHRLEEPPTGFDDEQPSSVRTEREPTSRGVLHSPLTIWFLLQGLLSGGVALGVWVSAYALVDLRVEKMEIVYQAQGVPFAAGPDGVPADQWQRMSATQSQIVEPMANSLLVVGASTVVFLLTVQVLLGRLLPVVLPRSTLAHTGTHEGNG